MMDTLATLPAAPKREFLRAHATAGMVIALAGHARNAADLALLDDAEEIAAMLCDRYDGPHARFVVWNTRGAVLRALGCLHEARVALDRAAAELDTAPPAYAAAFRADLSLDRATLLMELGDPAAARESAWSAAQWFRETGERTGVARVARIVTQ